MALEPVTAAHRLTYNENVQLAVQQRKTRLVERCTYQPTLKGRQARVVQLIGTTEARVDAERKSDTPDIEASVEDVYCQPRRIDWGRLLEKDDDIKAMIDYQSVAVQDGAAAIARRKDAIVAEAFFGPRRVGQDGLTVEPWAGPSVAHDYVASGSATASGLTVDKIIRGVSLMASNEVDVESDPLFMAVTNIQMENLFRFVQLQSTDFRREYKVVLDEGMKTVIEFFGVQFVRFQRLPTIGVATRRRCPLWAKSGMHYGDFMPLETQLERNPAKAYRLHPYMETYVGATRSEDAKVVSIECNEA